MYACMYAYVRVYVCTCKHECMYMCASVFMYVCMYVCVYVCMYVCMRVCVCMDARDFKDHVFRVTPWCVSNYALWLTGLYVCVCEFVCLHTHFFIKDAKAPSSSLIKSSLYVLKTTRIITSDSERRKSLGDRVWADCDSDKLKKGDKFATATYTQRNRQKKWQHRHTKDSTRRNTDQEQICN